MAHANFTLSPTTPATNGQLVTIFNTYEIGIGNFFALSDISRMVFDFEHSHSATLNWYHSNDGTTSIQLGTEALAAPAASETNVRDFLVEGYKFWKLEWVNGATAQDPWVVRAAGTDQRVVAD
jgi:hypothetical protein